MKTKFSFYLLLATLTLVTACKKYPEGGTEKSGPSNILGNWKLTLYQVDGIDSTNLINYNGTETYKTVFFFGEVSDPKNNQVLNGQPKGASNCDMSFSSNNEILNATVNPFTGAKNCWGTPITCYKEIFTPETNRASWKILQLTNKDMHLQCQLLHTYNLKLVKTN